MLRHKRLFMLWCVDITLGFVQTLLLMEILRVWCYEVLVLLGWRVFWNQLRIKRVCQKNNNGMWTLFCVFDNNKFWSNFLDTSSTLSASLNAKMRWFSFISFFDLSSPWQLAILESTMTSNDKIIHFNRSQDEFYCDERSLNENK